MERVINLNLPKEHLLLCIVSSVLLSIIYNTPPKGKLKSPHNFYHLFRVALGAHRLSFIFRDAL